MPSVGVSQAVVASLVLAATATCAADGDAPPGAIELQPYASNPAPLSASVDIAIMPGGVVCMVNSYETRIHCVDRDSSGVTVFGGQARGLVSSMAYPASSAVATR